MRYPPDLVETLAAEYVLGTLHGGARRRFKSLLRMRADARYAVRSWEALLYGLAEGIEPVRPPRSVWRGVRRRIEARSRAPAPRLRLRLAVAMASVALVAFWLGTILPHATAPAAPERIAVFADADSRPLWTIGLESGTGRLVANSDGVPAADGDRVYELWALPADGAPHSLGLLPTAAGRFELTPAPGSLAAIEQSASLAISLEPAGGSPTGLPTGPVVYQAALVRL